MALLRHVMMVVGALLAGCATESGVYLPSGTLVLGEVRWALTPEMVAAERLGPSTQAPGLAKRMQEQGITEAQLQAGRVLVLRDGIYWHNTASGIKREMLYTALVPQGASVEVGNIVEAALSGPNSGAPNTIARVRSKSLAEGHCFFDDLPASALKEVMGAVSLVGAGGRATLYCTGIEQEGWQRPRTYWHKLPSGKASADSAGGGPLSSAPAPLQTAPEPAKPPDPAVGNDLATLVIKMTHTPIGLGFFDLTVRVNGTEVTKLQPGRCDVVLLGPGAYQVSAGTVEGLGVGWPKRELSISVTAGQKMLVEYTADHAVQPGLWEVLTFKTDWLNRAYRFTSRSPASDADADCRLRHQPMILPRLEDKAAASPK